MPVGPEGINKSTIDNCPISVPADSLRTLIGSLISPSAQVVYKETHVPVRGSPQPAQARLGICLMPDGKGLADHGVLSHQHHNFATKLHAHVLHKF